MAPGAGTSADGGDDVRSRDLARLAGVSVRTLRHYHQIGLLPEPPRSANGYRSYAASDLIRVLRVRRLTDLGMPLSRIDPRMDIDAELALLDDDYARQIEHLRRRREAIRALRQRDTPVDTPAFAREYLAVVGGRRELPTPSVEIERDAALLLESILDPASISRLTALRQDEIERLADVSAALLDLDEDASHEHLDTVVDALVSVLRQVTPLLLVSRPTPDVARSFDVYVDDQLPPVQRETVRRAVRRLRD